MYLTYYLYHCLGRPGCTPWIIHNQLAQIEQKSGNRLAVFVFLATFLGTLLGVVADLSDASNLVAPILETFSPSPELHIIGSDTILGENLGMAGEWRDKFQAQEQWAVNIPLVGPVARTVKMTIAGIGTVKGIESAAAGQAVNILAASEPLTPERTQQLASAGVTIQCAAEIGYDVIAFITDFNNGAPRMSAQDMSKIFSRPYFRAGQMLVVKTGSPWEHPDPPGLAHQ